MKKAFTLVELLVSISILAVLSTLGFTYMSGFFQDSRDVTRISDLNNMEKALEVFFVKKGYIPEPDGAITIVHDGTKVWTQGTFGQSTLRTIRQLSHKPVDPLHENEYSYSVLSGRKEYELSTIFEGDIIAKVPGIATANAAEKTAYTLGNYNKKLVSIRGKNTQQILALPSITTATLETPELNNIIQNNNLVIHGETNLAANYNQDFYNQTGQTIFNTAEYIIFEGNQKNLSSPIEQKKLIKKLQEIYKTNPNSLDQKQYDQLMSIDVSNRSQVKGYINFLSIKQQGGFSLR